MTTLTQLVEALGAKLDTIPGLRVTDHVPQSSEFPAAFIEPPSIDYDNLADSGAAITFDIVLLVSSVTARNQKLLFPWLHGPGSIHAVLQADRSLGLSDVDVHAVETRSETAELAGYGAYGAVVTVAAQLGP